MGVAGDITNRGKLRKLFERTNDIKTQLATSPFKPQEILPVIMTSLPETETLSYIEELRTYGIATIAREAIERFLIQIDAPPSHEQLFANVVAAIPKAAASG